MPRYVYPNEGVHSTRAASSSKKELTKTLTLLTVAVFFFSHGSSNPSVFYSMGLTVEILLGAPR